MLNSYDLFVNCFYFTGMAESSISYILALAIISAFYVAITTQTECFDTMCWSVDRSTNISCDHSNHHCRLDKSGNPFCLPGSTDVGIKCNTSNRYFHRYCAFDEFGQASCDCFGAYFFWSMISVMSFLFIFTQLCILCHYCKNKPREHHSTVTIEQDAAFQRVYGSTTQNTVPFGVMAGVTEPLLPPEPGDSLFRANAPPPSYSDVANDYLSNPAANPYWHPIG